MDSLPPWHSVRASCTPAAAVLLLQPWVPVAQLYRPVQARAVDAKIAKEGAEGLGPLTGVPLAIKVRDTRTW